MSRVKGAAPSLVGYGKPPEEHRFSKGKSGNPAGRPPKRGLGIDGLSGASAAVAKELGRKVRLTEGGKPVTLDVFTAVIRATTVAALKGSPVAQKTLIQFGLAIHEANTKSRKADFDQAVKFKVELEGRRDAWVASGRAEMDMPIHPSDIELDHVKSEARLFVALTDEERAGRRRLVELRDELEERIARSLRVAEKEGDDVLLQIGRDAARATLLEIDKRLPARLRSTRAKS